MKTDTLFIGVDNGLSGAVAFLTSPSKCIGLYPLPILKAERLIDEVALKKLLNTILNRCSPERVIVGIEAPALGLRGKTNAQAIASTGTSFGQTRAVFALQGYHPFKIIPQHWHKTIWGGARIVSGGDKSQSIQAACALFPEQSLLKSSLCKVPSPDMAEALLIARHVALVGGPIEVKKKKKAPRKQKTTPSQTPV